jgi:hypothetical protein
MAFQIIKKNQTTPIFWTRRGRACILKGGGKQLGAAQPALLHLSPNPHRAKPLPPKHGGASKRGWTPAQSNFTGINIRRQIASLGISRGRSALCMPGAFSDAWRWTSACRTKHMVD